MTKKKKKTSKKSPAQKAADTMRERRADKAAKEAGRAGILRDNAAAIKAIVEKTHVEVTPYPRAGDNKDFEGVLDRVGLESQERKKTEFSGVGSDKPEQPPQKLPQPAAGEVLKVSDIAEWVAWPFTFWAQVNALPGLALSQKEARSVAEPLTRILNRHEASRLLPPDYVDGLIASARLSPIMGDRLAAVKKERDRRAAAGEPSPSKVAPGPAGKKVDQGAAATKPREV